MIPINQLLCRQERKNTHREVNDSEILVRKTIRIKSIGYSFTQTSLRAGEECQSISEAKNVVRQSVCVFIF